MTCTHVTRGGRFITEFRKVGLSRKNVGLSRSLAVARYGHCAVPALRNRIYILGGTTRALEVFDMALLEWRAEARACAMPESR